MSYYNQGGHYGNSASRNTPYQLQDGMNQAQMGKAQFLVNLDEQHGYKYLNPGDRFQLQNQKHDLKMNGIFDPQAQKILDKY